MLDGKHSHADILSFDVATVAIKGMRTYQEDSLISSFPLGQDTGFAILSDGMGGHTSGHVASALERWHDPPALAPSTTGRWT